MKELEKSKVLLVDDRNENLIAVKTTLKVMDYVEFICANNGHEALAATLNHEFALIIMDVEMPDMDGYELASFLREEERTKQVPIIFMSAVYSENYNEFHNKNTGAVDFLTKPYNPNTLFYKTELLVSVQRQKMELKLANQELQKEHKKLLATQAQLIEAAKLASIGTMSSGIAHELNQPLTVILFSVTEASECLEDNEYNEIPEILERIKVNVKRASAITKNMQHFGAELMRGKADSENLEKLIKDTLSVFETQLSNAGMKTIIKIEPDLPKIFCKAKHLEQALGNLVSNARYSMLKTEMKELTISLYSENSNVVIEVNDTGNGISEENMPHLFDPFFTTKTVGQGQGLGLSASYGIIKEHRGNMTVSSTEGQGSTFKIVLPKE